MIERSRVLIAGFFHETHTFVDDKTGLGAFDIRRGEALLARAGDASTIDGFLEVARTENWDVVPVAEFMALPSGTIDNEVLEQFWHELEAGLSDALAAGPLDAIWLALHGAAVTTGCEDPEGELLARIRKVPGAETLPLFGVFDLHATFTKAMAANANGLVAYRENPHSDAREAAADSARLLARTLETGIVPRMLALNADIVWPPTGTGTADSPMRDLEALARRIEADEPAIWAVNVVAGFSFSDVRDAGVAFSLITTGDDATAQAALQSLNDLAVKLRANGLPKEWNLDEALADIDAGSVAPCLIVEPGDNIGAGAPGDCTAVLRAMLRHRTKNAALVIADAETVESLKDARPGEVRLLRVGGKGSALDAGPVAVMATLKHLSGGKFKLEDRHSHLAASQGASFDMGPCAVVTLNDGDITLLLTSRRSPPWDLAQLRTQGIEPEKLAVIGIKAAVAHRRAYDPIAAKSYTVTTPGPCTSDLSALPYRRLRRPIYPLDTV